MHHTKYKGDIALMKISLDLTEKGYAVFLPVSEHLPFDLIAYKNGKCFRIQAKYSAGGEAKDSTYSGSHKSKNYNENDFDYYGLYLPEIDKCIYPSIKFKGSSFRFQKCNSAISFYWYEDFIDFTDDAKRKNYRDMGWEIDIIITENVLDRAVKRRKVERPTIDEVKKLVEEKGYSETGRMFGVSDNAVRKWIKFAEKYEQKDLLRKLDKPDECGIIEM